MQPAGNLAQKEARYAKRDRVMLSANIAFNNGAFSTSCVVTQLSQTGARLSLPADAPISNNFRIQIPQRSFEADARLVWRRGAYAGIAFIDEHAAASPAQSDTAEENKRLRALVAQLELRLKEMGGGY